MYLPGRDVYHYMDCCAGGYAASASWSKLPPQGRWRLACCCIGWGISDGHFMASDVLRLVNDAVRDCIARQGHHPLGGTAGDGGQAKVTAAAEGVAASCLPSLPPSVGYADANVDSVYHTLLACPLLQRQRQRSPEVWVVGTADFRLCAKCEGMELIGRRLAPADGATKTLVVSFPTPVRPTPRGTRTG